MEDSAKAAITEVGAPYIRKTTTLEFRPNAKMPIRVHKIISRLLAELSFSIEDHYLNYKISSVRSELDEWLYQEYALHEIRSDHDGDIYFGKSISPSTYLATGDDKIAHLRQICDILDFYYPNCQPLGAVLVKLNEAVERLQSAAH